MKKTAFLSLVAGVVGLFVPTGSAQLLYSDQFNTDTSAGWITRSSSTDFTAQFGFDYGAVSYTFNGATRTIPAAPNSGGITKGLKLTVNKNDAVTGVEGVNLYPAGKSFSGNYSMTFDMWINYNGPAGGGTGSTETALFGMNQSSANLNWLGGRTNSDGIWFAVNGEGGSSATSATLRDYNAFVGSATNSIRLSKADGGLVGEDHAEAVFTNMFPSATFETMGAPGKNWIQVELRQVNGTVSWLMNGNVIATRQNTSSFTSGDVMLGYMDSFAGIANPPGDNYVIYDNLRVTLIPEPSALALGVAGLCVLCFRTLRKTARFST